MKRRAFFKQAFRQVTEGLTRAVVQVADRRAEQKAARWIRPPFARSELDFLLLCTRCDTCVEACVPGVLFALPPRTGPEVAGTPAMDLLNKGCTMCLGWPCVTVCEPKALDMLDAGGRPRMPKMARVQIDPKHCLPYIGPECGVCDAVCPIPGAVVWDDGRPDINEARCTGCALCRAMCPTHPKAMSVKPLTSDRLSSRSI